MRGINNSAMQSIRRMDGSRFVVQSAADGALRLLSGADNKRPIKMQIGLAHAFV